MTPSGSCTHHLRHKFSAAPDLPERRKISASVYDLVEFLYDVLQVRELPATEFHSTFPSLPSSFDLSLFVFPPYAMFKDYWKYDWVLPLYRYEGLQLLLAALAEKVASCAKISEEAATAARQTDTAPVQRPRPRNLSLSSFAFLRKLLEIK